jgi:hypothetical protein
MNSRTAVGRSVVVLWRHGIQKLAERLHFSLRSMPGKDCMTYWLPQVSPLQPVVGGPPNFATSIIDTTLLDLY